MKKIIVKCFNGLYCIWLIKWYILIDFYFIVTSRGACGCLYFYCEFFLHVTPFLLTSFYKHWMVSSSIFYILSVLLFINQMVWSMMGMILWLKWINLTCEILTYTIYSQLWFSFCSFDLLWTFIWTLEVPPWNWEVKLLWLYHPPLFKWSTLWGKWQCGCSSASKIPKSWYDLWEKYWPQLKSDSNQDHIEDFKIKKNKMET